MSEDHNSQGAKMIAFRVGDQEFCVDIMSVREIRGWSVTTPLPNSPPYMRGVINLRGSVVPIVDVSQRLGMGAAAPNERHVIIVVDIAGKLAGLLVDAVLEILDAPAEAIQRTPEMAEAELQAFVTGLINIDRRIVAVVDLAQVFPTGDVKAA